MHNNLSTFWIGIWIWTFQKSFNRRLDNCRLNDMRYRLYRRLRLHLPCDYSSWRQFHLPNIQKLPDFSICLYRFLMKTVLTIDSFAALPPSRFCVILRESYLDSFNEGVNFLNHVIILDIRVEQPAIMGPERLRDSVHLQSLCIFYCSSVVVRS